MYLEVYDLRLRKRRPQDGGVLSVVHRTTESFLSSEFVSRNTGNGMRGE